MNELKIIDEILFDLNNGVNSMNDNNRAMIVGGILLIIGIIVFSESNNLKIVLPISSTQLIGVIVGIIGAAIAILAGLKESEVI